MRTFRPDVAGVAGCRVYVRKELRLDVMVKPPSSARQLDISCIREFFSTIHSSGVHLNHEREVRMTSKISTLTRLSKGACANKGGKNFVSWQMYVY